MGAILANIKKINPLYATNKTSWVDTGIFNAKVILMQNFVQKIYEGKDGETLVSASSYMNKHALDQDLKDGQVLFELYQTIDQVKAFAIDVAKQAFNFTVIRSNGLLTVERRLIPIDKIMWISDKALLGKHFHDHNHFPQRSATCENQDFSFVGVQYENEYHVLQVLGDIDTIAANLCGGSFIDACWLVQPIYMMTGDLEIVSAGSSNWNFRALLDVLPESNQIVTVDAYNWTVEDRQAPGGPAYIVTPSGDTFDITYNKFTSTFDIRVKLEMLLSTGQTHVMQFLLQHLGGADSDQFYFMKPGIQRDGFKLTVPNSNNYAYGPLQAPLPYNWDEWGVDFDYDTVYEFIGLLPFDNDYGSAGNYQTRVTARDSASVDPIHAEGEIFNDIIFNIG